MRRETQMEEKHEAAVEQKQSVMTEEVQAMCSGRFSFTATFNITILACFVHLNVVIQHQTRDPWTMLLALLTFQAFEVCFCVLMLPDVIE